MHCWILIILGNILLNAGRFQRKDSNFHVLVLQGNVETVIRGGGKLYHFSVAYFKRNISAKNY